MRRFAILSALVGAAFLASSAAAGDIPATPDDAKEKKICRKDVATGSVMVKRTCRTKAEWDALTAQGREQADKMRSIDSTRNFTRRNAGT